MSWGVAKRDGRKVGEVKPKTKKLKRSARMCRDDNRRYPKKREKINIPVEMFEVNFLIGKMLPLKSITFTSLRLIMDFTGDHSLNKIHWDDMKNENQDLSVYLRPTVGSREKRVDGRLGEEKRKQKWVKFGNV